MARSPSEKDLSDSERRISEDERVSENSHDLKDSHHLKELPDPNDPACPHASTIAILRDAPDAGGGLEVFMVKRHAKSRFLADRYVYPGGKLDPADCTPATARRARGRTRAQVEQALALADTVPGTISNVPGTDVATGLFLAGIRETFEEAGILLACRSGEDELIDLTSDPAVAERFKIYRQQLMRGQIALSQVAEAEDLVFPLDLVAYFSHWITPYREKTRYDTRFFLALAPTHQRPLHDARETSASTWITPQQAIQQNLARTLLLAPPTLHTLLQLGKFNSSRAAFEWALEHQPSTALPHVTVEASGAYLLLPGDPQFPHDDPAYRRATATKYGVTRMQMEGAGFWRPMED